MILEIRNSMTSHSEIEQLSKYIISSFYIDKKYDSYFIKSIMFQNIINNLDTLLTDAKIKNPNFDSSNREKLISELVEIHLHFDSIVSELYKKNLSISNMARLVDSLVKENNNLRQQFDFLTEEKKQEFRF